MSSESINEEMEQEEQGQQTMDSALWQQELSLAVNMKTRYMYSFLFQHLHRSFQGIFGVCISLAALIAFVVSLDSTEDTTRKVILLVIGLLFTVVNPVLLLIRAQKQVMLSPIYKQPLQYTFCKEGMKVSQGEEEQAIEWNRIVAVRKTPSVLIIYTSRNSGSILAFQEMGDQRQRVERVIAEGCRAAGVTKVPAFMKKLDISTE
ncbi:MAG: YcxB family protein [Bacteroides sp.]|nr:YcxB family protein [Bacteroides sp.]MCM1550563.1 YcxB family protein [Clostridium sp.]